MDGQYSIYLVLAPLTAMAAVGALFYSRRYRHTAPRDTLALQWLLTCLVGWLALDALELVVPTPSQTLFWARLCYGFIVTTPVSWLVFTLHHTGRSRWATPRYIAWLGIVPGITLLIALVDNWYTLLWSEYEFVEVSGLFPLHVIAHGPVFWIWVAYSYALIFAGAILLTRHYVTGFRLYRQQSRLVVVAAFIPIVFNAVYALHLVPDLHEDYTPISFALASILLVVGMARYRLFDVKPIARDVVVDALNDPVVALDMAGRVVDLNQAAVALLRSLRREEPDGQWIGRPVDQVLAAWPELAGHLPAAQELRVSLTTTIGDGTRYYDCHALPLVDPGGRRAGQVVVLHDITAHAAAAAELRHYAEVLEGQNQELNAFASTVAHDLKNPLTVIQSYTEMLSEDSAEMTEHDVQTFLRTISDSTEWMVHIVDELLLLARVRQASDVPIFRLDMEGIVYQVVSHLERQIHRSKARVKIATGWPDVLGHTPWVAEVWANYLSNALKYGGRPDLGQPSRVELGFDPDPATPLARFWVRDQGPGISPQEQEKLFVAFSRLHANEHTVGGHGLGLSIVQRIVYKLGGEVGVESFPGEGSTFWFTLPRAGITAPDSTGPETPAPHPEMPPDTPRAARGHTVG